jgi:hypothetical protein
MIADSLHRKRDLQPVILAQRPQRRRDDRARSAEPQTLRHVGFVFQREVAIRQLDALRSAVIHEADNQRLDDPNAAVIAAPPGNPVQVIEVLEDGKIYLGRFELTICRENPG